MRPMNVFLAHPKGLEGQKIWQLADRVKERLRTMKPDRQVLVTSGILDWGVTFKACGSWARWCERVAVGTGFPKGEPIYHAIVVAPSAAVGAAMKEIVRRALEVKKPVAFFDGERIRRVKGLREIDPEDFKAGWEVTLG